MTALLTRAYGDTRVQLEADALRQAHDFFGYGVPLRVVPDYEVRQFTGLASAARWQADVRVTPEREPPGQSEVAESVRRQVQWARDYAVRMYGVRKYGRARP